MAVKYFDTKALDEILENMIETVNNSKQEIFQIGEQCRKDTESIYEELKKIQEMVASIIKEEDELEERVRFARKRLAEVSKNFHKYSEEEVREVYEHAHSLQLKLTMTRQLEKQLRERRDDLERRLVGLKETIERADQLSTQVNVVLNYLTGDLKDISEFIEDANAKQEFGLRVIEMQEEERKRISREIHDGPAQMLAHVLMRSNVLEKVFREQGINETINEFRQFKRILRNALYEVRHIIYDLRPMALDDLGLVPTLKKYLQTVEEYNQKAKISFLYLGEDKRLANNMEVALFRLIQESVQNALKHSEAETIQVKLEITNNQVIAIIKDDGIGFDVNEPRENAFGLIGMRERVQMLEGKLTIQSKKGQGTTVTIQVPLHE
mgnify:CR=1 FL=1